MRLATLIVRAAARLVPVDHRARWREEWLAELEAVAPRGVAATLRFAAGAPTDAWSTRPPQRLGSALVTDLTNAGRQLLRRPAYTLAVIACLVVGLVASVATFSLITSLFYGDMPGIYQRRSLARIYLNFDSATGTETAGGGQRVSADPLSYDDFAIMRTLSPATVLTSIGAEGSLLMTATGDHGPTTVTGAFASADFFATLRTVPERGRFFTAADDRADAPPVAIVADHFWRTELNGREDAIGQPILVGGQSFTVIGVAPPRFHGMQPLEIGQDDSNGVQTWVPLAHAPLWPTRPPLDDGWLMAVGRIAPGHTIEEVRNELSVPAARIAATNPQRRANATAFVRHPGIGAADAPVQVLAILAALLALPLTVLAIGCANVANLQLARVAEQTRELALRLALGATRAQLVRLLTIETLARVTVAVAVSMGLILLIIRRVQPLFPVYITINPAVLVFAVTLAAVVALATGLVPAWLVLRRTAAGQMKQTAQSGGLGHSRMRSALIVAQVALSLGLLVLTGLFARTVQSMTADAPAALREQMVARFDPASLRMTPRDAHDFATLVAARAAADGRVKGVALSMNNSIRFGATDAPRTNDRAAAMVAVTASWFNVMNVPVMSGRGLTDADDSSTAVLSAAAADLVSPDHSPLGQVIRVDDGSGTPQRLQIVGVVADSRVRPTTERPDPVVYVPFPDSIDGAFTLRVRSETPDGLRADLQTIINDVDPRIVWTSIRRGDMQFDDDAREMAVAVYSVGAAGLIGLILSATGLYAVMSYVVTLRRREIGVRLAIGAPPARIVALILRQSMRLVLVGVAGGLTIGVPMAFAMRAMFIAPVNAVDPVAFLPAMALLVVVGALASAIPALRASRVDPVATLRQD